MKKEECAIKKLQDAVGQFVGEREWQQYQTPKNVSAALSVEAAELLEYFIWIEGKESYEMVKHNHADIEREVADIMINLLNFCTITNINLEQAVLAKLEQLKTRYPVSEVKGNHTTYYKIKKQSTDKK